MMRIVSRDGKRYVSSTSKPQELHTISNRPRTCRGSRIALISTPRRNFKGGAELLKQTLCVNAGRYELCILAKHLAEDLLTAPVNEDDTAQVDNAGQ